MAQPASVFEFHTILDDAEGQAQWFLGELSTVVQQVSMYCCKERMLLARVDGIE